MKKDIFGIEPKIGDIIVFNPPKYKGLVYGKCIGFTKVGLPIIEHTSFIGSKESIKTDFLVHNYTD